MIIIAFEILLRLAVPSTLYDKDGNSLVITNIVHTVLSLLFRSFTHLAHSRRQQKHPLLTFLYVHPGGGGRGRG